MADTLASIYDKFTHNFKLFFDLLIAVSQELRDSGYDCPSPVLLQTAYNLVLKEFTAEDLLYNFAATHDSWAHFDTLCFEPAASKDVNKANNIAAMEFVEHNIKSFFGERTPEIFKQLAVKIFTCRDASGSVALGGDDIQAFGRFFDSFIKLSVKYVHLKRVPTGNVKTDDGSMVIFSYSQCDLFPEIDTSKEIHKRQIKGIAY